MHQGIVRGHIIWDQTLRSFDSNKDMVLSKEDENWKKLKLWIDDGDAISEATEIYDLSDYIDRIDVNNVSELPENPDWANGNNVLRELVGFKEDMSYKLYDVGFEVAPGR